MLSRMRATRCGCALALVATPERVIMGGGVINAQPHLVARIRDKMGKSLAGYSSPLATPVARERFLQTSGLGRNVGPLGALALARAALAERGALRLPDLATS